MEDNHNTRGQQSFVIVPVFTPEKKGQKNGSLPSPLPMLSVECPYNSEIWKTQKKKKLIRYVVHVLYLTELHLLGLKSNCSSVQTTQQKQI